MLRILPLRFVLRSQGIRFPAFSGSIWHGGLGNMLAVRAPEAFRILYQTEQDARLYSILPTREENLPAGAEFELRVTLFGPGVDCALAVTQAVMELGRTGLRPGGNYDLIRAEGMGIGQNVPYMTDVDGFIGLPCAWSVSEIIALQPPQASAVNVHFITPARIKFGNDLLRQAPTMEQLIRRILGRLDQIGFSANETVPLEKIYRSEIFEEAQKIVLSHAQIEPMQLQRRSARSLQQMQFEGFIGATAYTGCIDKTLPWLHLASLIQIGGKTAFGFGGISIETQLSSTQGEQHG